MNYYNEIDPKAAAWLRELIAGGHIPRGDVDERSIVDVGAGDLRGYIQCHWFAGIGGWPYALRLAGWPDDRPVWTGSCPCQPFSVANVAHGGKRGKDDPRHLWPVFSRLISECRPATVFGEQVAGAISNGWLDDVFDDMEAIGYACCAAVLPACAYGAPHERQRLYWLSDASGEGWEGCQPDYRTPVPAKATLPIACDAFARARSALAGDFRGLLPCDGLSVVMERDAIKGYGNAIVPQCAQVFVQSFLDLQHELVPCRP